MALFWFWRKRATGAAPLRTFNALRLDVLAHDLVPFPFIPTRLLVLEMRDRQLIGGLA